MTVNIQEKYEKLQKQAVRADCFIERAAITFRAIKRSEICSCCKNKVHLFTPGKEGFQQRLDAIKKYHLKGISDKVNKFELEKMDLNSKYNNIVNKLVKTDTQIQDMALSSRIPLYKVGQYLKLSSYEVKLAEKKKADSLIKDYGLSSYNQSLSGGLEQYNKAYEQDKTCNFCFDNLPNTRQIVATNNLSKT